MKPFANAIFLLDGPAEVVRFQITGHGRLVEATELEVIGLGDGDYCLNGPCVCPPGMHFENGEPGVLNTPLKIGVSGFTDGALGSIRGMSIRDLCSPGTTPRPSGSRPVEHAAPRCGTRCPSSNGDPHLRTVDGVGYGFQAAGEFVLLSSPDGKVEVQVRQEPAPGVELGHVSNNTALAMRLGEHRVGLYATATGIDVRVDGLIHDGDLLEVGGSLVRHRDGIEIELADGSIVWAVSNAPYGLNLLVDPSPNLVDTGVGLLGRSAPGLGVPLLPDGSALPKPIDRHEAYASLYVRFAGAWRLTDATTMFDYEAGKTTATYTIPDYPSEPKVATFRELDPAAAAAGREACAAVADDRPAETSARSTSP